MSTLRTQRLAALGKAVPTVDFTQALTQTIGVQAQQLRQAEVGLALQVPSLTHDALLTAYQNNDVVRTWAQRWTYQLLTKADWALMIAARLPEQLPTTYFQNQRDLFVGVAQDLIQTLDTVDTLSKTQVDAQLDELAGKKLLSQERYVIFQLAAHAGAFTFVPKAGNQYELRAQHNELIDPDEAIKQLMPRYLDGFGPASLADFCKWAGLSISRVRPLWQAASRDWLAVGEQRFVAHPPVATALPEVILTAGFDAALTGYVDKTWLVDSTHQSQLWTKNGILNPLVIVNGNVVGTWHFNVQGKRLMATLACWAKLSASQDEQIKAKLAHVAAFLGLTLNR